MPRFPHFSGRERLVSGSVFERFAPKMREQGDSLVRLHIGDSYLPPTYEIPLDNAFTTRHSTFNRYCNTYGIPELRQLLAAKVRTENGLALDADGIMMTSGASNALNIAMMALVKPGEEVLVTTPCWPFFQGMVRLAGGTPIEVPLYMGLYEAPEMDISACLERHIGRRTVAIYVNSPNNPSGKVLTRRQLQQIADVARTHGLWVISDEAYDGMTFDGHEHISIGSFPEMEERTISIFTFSKVYMFAGMRLGYMAAQPGFIRKLNRLLVHQLYGPTTVGQYMMLKPVAERREWNRGFVDHCRELRDLSSDLLEVEHHKPEGAYYLFFSTEPVLGGRDYWTFVETCVDSGVSLAPGQEFGADFAAHIRICFAGESPDRLATGIERLNRVFSGR